MTREGTQEAGRKGVALTKRWLEATTFVEFPWNAYENEELCYVDHLNAANGGYKCFDLVGSFLEGDRHPIAVENKAVNTETGLYDEFQEFLAIAYSSTILHYEKYKKDGGREFFWVTTHPFKLGRWRHLHTAEEVSLALDKHSEYLAGREIDQKVLQDVADRIWVLAMNRKQEQLSLNHTELMAVFNVLPRKKTTL